MKLLLSIKPEFAHRIFSGEKTFEFRKAIHQQKSISTVAVYASMLVGSIGYVISLGAVTAAFFAGDPEAGMSSGASALVLAGLILFIAAHAFGQGSVI